MFPKGTIRHTKQSGEIISYSKALRMDPCSYCGGEGGTMDHIVPRHPNKGSNSFDNLTGACPTCNGMKSSKVMLLFLLEIGGLR